jgi:hypothetical protein
VSDLRDSPYLREVISAQTARYAPEVSYSTAVATGPAMSSFGYFGGIAPYRTDLYLESKLYSPRYEPIPVTRLARSEALGGELIVPVYAIDLETGELNIDWYRDSTARENLWAERESNPHSQRRLIYSQRSSPHCSICPR